eukprot:g12088.t1
MMSAEETSERPEDSTLLRISRGLGVAFWVAAVANGIFLVFSLRSHTFWSSIHQLSGGLLLVLVAGACGAWEVKAMRKADEERWCTKAARETFLAGMYFVPWSSLGMREIDWIL